MRSQLDLIARSPVSQPLFSAYGIDLGTTNSAIAALAWQPLQGSTLRAECLAIKQPLPEGEAFISATVPSVVAVREHDILIGEGAKWLKARSGSLPGRNLFYECKNDIGVRRTYHEAPPGFRTAREVSATILEFLMQQATGLPGPWSQPVVVTVPASFSVAQRRETIAAAQMAGHACREGMLLDEPVAAFIDYVIRHGDRLDLVPGAEKHLLVFDFGGGTSDVAIFSLTGRGEGNPMQIAPLAVSRYYQIGGGDIDRAIVHKVLIPQLVEQNSLARYALGFPEKKRLEAPLSELAEVLKIRLCQALTAARERGDSAEEIARLSGAVVGDFPCPAGRQELHLRDPVLHLAAFAEVLQPFLDPDLLYPKENEYVKTNSIVAPLKNTLEQCRLAPEQIDSLLLVGGSCLIPQVADLLTELFPTSEILAYRNPAEMAGAVARGAAYQALSLAQYGKGIMETVCGDRILVRAEGGGVELLPKGAALPYPAEGFALCTTLALPETSVAGTTLKVEIEGGSGRLLFSSIWEIGEPVRRGEPLRLEYRMDADQILHLRLGVGNRDLPEFTCLIEHPLTAVHNSNDRRNKMLELEEDLRLERFSPAEEPDKVLELAMHCAALGQNEKALGVMGSALGKIGPDADILNYMGLCCANLGDSERAEKLYRESAAVEPLLSTPLFNLALAKFRQGQYAQGLDILDEAIARCPEPPYYILRAQFLEKLGRPAAEQDAALELGISGLAGSVARLGSWELFWLRKGAERRQDVELLKRLDDEQKRRDTGEGEGGAGKLPIICQELVASPARNKAESAAAQPVLLIAEDDDCTLTGLVEGISMLYPGRFDLIPVRHGAEAVEVLKQRYVDIVWTNLNMPRMDGFELMAFLRRNHPGLPYAAFTGYGGPDIEKQVLEMGAYAFFEKPWDYAMLEHQLDMALVMIGREMRL
jgi:molecular chaperone DnaK (HSP70)/CheY-like chemotaxis protein/tetratricopeptide (TPR) repeat protein